MSKKIAVFFLGASLLISPLILSAQTIEEVQAQIQALLAQLAQLQGSSPPPPPTGTGGSGGTNVPTFFDDDFPSPYPINVCPGLSRTLQRGARDATTGGQVTELQIFLANVFNLNEEEVVSGYFGRLTEKYVIQFQNQHGLPAFGIVGSLTRMKIAQICGGTPQPSYPISVTAPNGGEEWEIGQLNTITWSPYGYNPDVNPARDVTVYLENLDGSNAGVVVDTGKASLHTYFNIDSYGEWAKPGQYYIHVVNKVTRANDRSDAPFTLLPKSVDLKVNGSDGPVSVADNQAISLSWSTANFTFPNGCTLSGIRAYSGGGMTSINVAASGSATYYAYAPVSGSYTPVQLSCIDGAKGLVHTDYAGVISVGGSTSASLQVLSPNGGEQIKLDQPMTIHWAQSGLRTASIALYRNDQWYYWIDKDLELDSIFGGVFTWNPKIADVEVGKNIYKIYITGQRADGQGYIDDKSDAPFSFGSSGGGEITISASPSSGRAPLNVLFSARLNSADCNYYTVDFGDDVLIALDQYITIPRCSPNSFNTSWSHTYTTPGTYTVRLLKSPFQACATVFCPFYNVPHYVVGSLTIRVEATTPWPPPTFTATPASGNAPLAVTFSASGGGSIDFGDGQSEAVPPSTCWVTVNGGPSGCNSSELSHTYAAAGTYTATLSVTTGGGVCPSVLQSALGGTEAIRYPYPSPCSITPEVKTVVGTMTIKVAETPVTSTPGNPTGLGGACIGGGKMKLSWDKTPGAEYYLVRVNDAANDSPACQDGWYCAGTTDARIEDTYSNEYVGPIRSNSNYSWWILAVNKLGSSQTVSGPTAWCPSSNDPIIPLPTPVPTPTPASTPVCHEERVCTGGGGDSLPTCTMQTMCTSASAPQNSNLASALSALQAALSALLGKLSR